MLTLKLTCMLCFGCLFSNFSSAHPQWSWGFDGDEFQLANQTKKPPPSTTEKPTTVDLKKKFEVCSPLPYTPPNFSAPGRRTSQVKCYEYIWDISFRLKVADRAKQCTREVNKEGGFDVGIAAVGGRDTVAGEFPHMGAIGWKAAVGNWIFKCGGSLISSKFVLTAAHCTKVSGRGGDTADPLPKIVRLGDKNILDNNANGYDPVDAFIQSIITHPNYKAPSKYNDIALFELTEHVKFDTLVHPGCLWGTQDLSQLGIHATLTGWGVVNTATQKTSPELQAADVDLVPSQQCDTFLKPSCNRNWCGVQDHQLCAGKLKGGVDSCQGDSGGPLQVKVILPSSVKEYMHYIIGVTSFGIGCGNANKPGVYTRVSSFIDWIENIVWP